jgi:hypothetical protein
MSPFGEWVVATPPDPAPLGDLGHFLLTLDDLPAGEWVEHEQPYEPDTVVVMVRSGDIPRLPARIIKVQFRRIGAGRAFLSQSLSLYTPDDAQASMRRLRERKLPDALLARLLAPRGILEVESLPFPLLGDDTVARRTRSDRDGMTSETVSVTIRHGGALTTLIYSVWSVTAQHADVALVERLARIAADRLGPLAFAP